MKKRLIICGACAALLAAAAVHVFRPVRLDTSGAVSARLHIVYNYGRELKYDGDLIPHIYSESCTLESGVGGVRRADRAALRRAAPPRAPGYGAGLRAVRG